MRIGGLLDGAVDRAMRAGDPVDGHQ